MTIQVLGCGSRHASAFLAGVQIALQVPVANDAVVHFLASHLSAGRKVAITSATLDPVEALSGLSAEERRS